MEEDKIINFINSLEMKIKLKPVNFFDIGARGLYENPFTEILAHLLSQDCNFTEKDEFRYIFLKSFMNNFEEQEIKELASSLLVNTQIKTTNGYFIDMLLYNNKYVFVYENKINHWLANPLDDYVREIEIRFPKHKKYYFVFSLRNVNTPQLWKNILIGEVFKKIKKNICFMYTNKWDYFVEEYLDHYISLEESAMDEKTLDFCSNNFLKLLYGNKLYNDFLLEIIKKVKAQYPEIVTSICRNFGSEFSTAIRFYLYYKDNKTNVALALTDEGKYNVFIYLDPPTNNIHSIKINDDKYKSWSEGKWMCYCLIKKNEITELNDAIKEISNKVEYLFYHDRSLLVE